MQLKLPSDPAFEGRPEAGVQNYELMLECFLTEQMSLRQLYGHMQEDDAFRDYVLAHISELKD